MIVGFLAPEPRAIPRSIKTRSTIFAMVWRSGTTCFAADSVFSLGIFADALSGRAAAVAVAVVAVAAAATAGTVATTALLPANL